MCENIVLTAKPNNYSSTIVAPYVHVIILYIRPSTNPTIKDFIFYRKDSQKLNNIAVYSGLILAAC
jgi:hypothetical protein